MDIKFNFSDFKSQQYAYLCANEFFNASSVVQNDGFGPRIPIDSEWDMLKSLWSEAVDEITLILIAWLQERSSGDESVTLTLKGHLFAKDEFRESMVQKAADRLLLALMRHEGAEEARERLLCLME